MSTVYTVNETDGNVALLEICAVLNVGTLERNVVVNLNSVDGSATSSGITV